MEFAAYGGEYREIQEKDMVTAMFEDNDINEIDPKAMLSDICDAFRGIENEVHYRDDSDYDYLTDNEVCLILSNPRGDNIFIDLRTEFTLSFAGYEGVFFPDEEGYKLMLGVIRGLIGGEFCAAVLTAASNGETASIIAPAEDAGKTASEIFPTEMLPEDFAENILEGGGTLRLCFWDQSRNRTEDIQPEA